MAATAGKTGAIYYRKAWIQAATIALVDGGGGSDTITDSDDGFVAAGFETGDLIVVSGATDGADNVTVELTGVAVGTLTFATGTFTTGEGAGELITVQEALPGTQILGFYNWSLSMTQDDLEDTAFEDVGIESSIGGIKRWTGTAAQHFQTTQLLTSSWLGEELVVRFFHLYDDAPNVTTVYFREGKCRVNGIDVATDAQGIVDETIAFIGQAQASIAGTGIALVDSDPDTITDTGDGFILAGFEAGQKIAISGSTADDGYYTIASVEAGTITLIAGDAFTGEGAGNYITIVAEVRLSTRTTAWPT